MDAFNLIQNFFTRMNCNFCTQHFEPEDISLIREEDGIYIVNVFCNHCKTQNGVAMVGVELPEGATAHAGYSDPELTEDELERLSAFKPIQEDDVLDAHYFFQNLDADWARLIPEEVRERCTAIDTEPAPDEAI